MDEGIRANYSGYLDGDKDSADTVLKIIDRRAKLFGYEPPQKVALDVTGQIEVQVRAFCLPMSCVLS